MKSFARALVATAALAWALPAFADEPISYLGTITLDTGSTVLGKVVVSTLNPLPVTFAGGSLGATVNTSALSGLSDGTSHALSLTSSAGLRVQLNDPTLGDLSFGDSRNVDQVVNSASSNAAYTVTLDGGVGSDGVTITGLTASGATLTHECIANSAAASPQWTTCPLQSGATTLTADGLYYAGVGGLTGHRFRISSTGTGNVTFSHSASVASPRYLGAVSSGLLSPIIECDQVAVGNNVTSGNTKIITGVAGKKTYLCSISLSVGASATSGKFTTGTGSNCGTGTADLSELGEFAANGGSNTGGNLGYQFAVAAATDVCLNNSSTNTLHYRVTYTQQPG